MADRLAEYNRKRHFERTPEPSGRARRGARTAGAQALSFVIQQHDATRLHYDFRLELDGSLKSWAVPKGPSLDPSVKRLAVHVEDHPLDYADFEGQIPAGNYGAGQVIVWDRGTWTPLGDAARDYAAGKLKFELQGSKLSGAWMLVRSKMRGSGDKEQWLLIKERDAAARDAASYDVTEARPESVKSGESIGQTALHSGAVWHSNKPARSDSAAAAPPRAKGAKSAKPATPARAGKARQAADAPAATAALSQPAAAAPVAADAADAAATGRFRVDSLPVVRLPDMLAPQLATLADAPPPGDGWIYEIKFDGYRLLARIETTRRGCKVQLFTRAGNDWTAKFPAQVAALTELAQLREAEIGDAWLDGEAVVLDEHGVPSFQALQNAFETGRHEGILLYLFDAPFVNGRDLRNVALQDRRAVLREAMQQYDAAQGHADSAADGVAENAAEDADGTNPAGVNPLRFSEDFGVDATDLLRSACAMSLEGLIGKRRDSGYLSGRSSAWIKLKCRQRQEFVIGGYTDPQGTRSGFGALLVGVYGEDDGQLHYAGRVGTGFNADMLDALMRQFSQHAARTSPFAEHSIPNRGRVHWLAPELVAEIQFGEWTGDAILRHAAFIALRTDKPARSIVRERARKGDQAMNQEAQQLAVGQSAAPVRAARKTTAAAKSTANSATKTARKATAKTAAKTDAAPAKEGAVANVVAGVKISHPERVVDSQSGTRKIDVVEHYAGLAEWLLPHLRDRPVSLVRAPDGVGGELFFQKHVARFTIAGLRLLDPALDPDHAALMAIDSAQALAGVAQMDTLELHTWNALAKAIEKPDRMVFDLDPDPALPWQAMLDAATLTHGLLDQLGLASFCKTSGGKGLHVVVPLTPQLGWEELIVFSKAIADKMAGTLPDHFSAKMGPKNRVGKIFVDTLRNRRGASTVAAYSARARPGMGVSVPIHWDELASLQAADQWNIGNIGARLASLRADPWADYWTTKQRVTAAMKKMLGIRGA